MVADNANISGDKINITSLVKEINDGTEVIKSSHILVDGANQSLSVVYNTIIGDISTLSTALSVEQGKISSLITDMSLAKGDVSTLQTNYSSLTQTVSGINSTVGEHTSTLTSVTSKQTQLEQTVNGFSGRISSIETTANNASSKVTEITATVNGLTTTVANKTDKGAIISTINQSAEAIKIQASKLELTGYVTMTNLSTSGQTSIDGGNIKTRTITAAKIASGTITATQIAANTITGAKIASKTITADKISVTSLSALTANLGTVTAGSLTSNTTISVSTNLTVGNNIYLNQNVNTTKYIYFNSSNYIRNLYTNSYNYITVNSNYRCALMSGSTSVYAYGNTGEAGISAAASIIFSSYGNGRLEHYGKYYDANWSSGFFRPLQAGTALGGSGASYRWYRLYAANTCSTSSDIRLKTNVKKYDVRYESMYMDLKPVTYELISTPGKTQCGLIAQWVKEAMDKNGISENEFALYEHDIREDSYSITNS